MTVGRVPTHPPSTHGTAAARDEFVLPASSAQQRLWFIDGLRPGNPAYNIPAVFALRGALDLDALGQSVADLVRRHEALRTTFRDAADGLRQVIEPEVASQPLEVVDLTGVAPEEREHLRTELIQEFVRRVFDLRAGPLVSVAVFQWSDTECTLLVNVHHAVADGWSMGVLLRELSQLYAARVEGGEPTLAPLELQYGDYAVWQEKRLEAGAFESQVDYWRQALAGAPQAIELPTDRPRPPLKTFDGGVEWLELTAGELAAVKAFARTQQVTPFLLLLAACAVVLGRYCRQEDVLIGTPLADRSRSETEALIGFLINTVVLRVDLSANPSIRELLRRLRDAAAGAAANHDLPFDKVVEALRPERDLSRTPVFQVMVTYQPDPLETLSLKGTAATSLPTHNGTSKFDLLFGFEEHALGLRGMLEYSTDLFDAQTIRRMAGHVRVVLAALVSNHPDRRISELPMLTSAERQQVVVDFNDQPNQPIDGCIHHFFHAQAARTPTARAVIHGDETLTYEDLRSRAARLAAHLRSIGVARGSLVGVCLERSPQLIITVLAILEAGGAYVPLDPAYPQERLRFILEDTDAAVVVTSAKVRDALPPCRARLVDVAAITGDHTAQTTNDGLNVGADDLAYVIYTSGSTGRPKGVALEHRTAVAMIRWARAVYSDADLAGVLASTSICFDLSVFEMFVPLSWGGAVVLAENALQLPFLPASGDVTLINTVPSAMTELLRMGNLPTGLRVAILAGERLRPTLVDEIIGRTTISQVFDVYGPSETSYTTCAGRGVGTPETIGRPLPGVRTYVLDRHRNPVPIGVPGELYIGGATVARGYLNRPELTAERFVADPFAPAGGSMYASGDLARWMPNGDLEYLGRSDHQVKLRGYRIELGEVEATLRRHPDVTDAVVAVREDVSGDQRLVAYLVVAAATTPGFASDVRGWLKTKLPDYMIPSAVVPMTAFPLTPNGKVDRSKLPAPEPAAPRGGIVAPRTDTERRVAEIWASVLPVDQLFGVDDSFFALGGHSIAALRVFVRIQRQFGVGLPLATLFEAPTVARLATILDAAAQPPAGQKEASPTRPDAAAQTALGVEVGRESAGAPARGLSIDIIRRSPCLAAIQPSGSKPPFFVLPGAGGNILGFQRVARYLDPDQPVIGLESLGRDGRHVPLTSLQAIAARFVVEMRSLQPDGPYALGGISFGGMVALEVAQQLQADGLQVSLLALLDTGLANQDEVHPSTSSWSMKARDFGQRLRRMASAVLLGSEGDRVGYLRVRARRVKRRVTTKRWRSRNEIHTVAERIDTGEQLPIAEALRHVRQANIQAYRAYRPVHYRDAITLFYATQREDGDATKANWQALCNSLIVHPVPGDHTTMMDEPNVQVLARKLGEALDLAHRETLEYARRA